MGLWKRLLLGVTLLVLLLIAGAVAFLVLADPNEYCGTVADLVENLTGRRLHIAGDLRVRLLPAPSVTRWRAASVDLSKAGIYPMSSRPEPRSARPW